MSNRPLNVGLVGGGKGAFIVHPHQKAIHFDGTRRVVAGAFGITLRVEAADDTNWSVPGRAATLLLVEDDRTVVVGAIGQVRPARVTARGGSDADVVVGGVLSVEARLPGSTLGKSSLAAGDKLAPLFPRDPNDKNELPNALVLVD